MLKESTQLTVQWEPPSASDQNGMIRRYEVHVTENNTGITVQVTSNNNNRMAIVSDLNPFTSYRVKVAAYTVALGPFSPVLEIVTLPAG